jgi:hypothetical protein
MLIGCRSWNFAVKVSSSTVNVAMMVAFFTLRFFALAHRTEKQLPGVGTTSSCELLSRVAFTGMNLRLAGLLVRSLYLKPVRRRLALRDVIIGNGADNKRPSVSEHWVLSSGAECF